MEVVLSQNLLYDVIVHPVDFDVKELLAFGGENCYIAYIADFKSVEAALGGPVWRSRNA